MMQTLAAQRFAARPSVFCWGTGAGTGVDSVWEQKKTEARKMPVNRDESRRPLHAVLGSGQIKHLILASSISSPAGVAKLVISLGAEQRQRDRKSKHCLTKNRSGFLV